jgi:hypothetical protein
MFKVDPYLAGHEFAALPLTQGSKRFVSWWMSQIAADGSPLPKEDARPIPGDLAPSTLVCEVRPWATVLCRSCGDLISRALGISLAGRDMLALVPPAQRAERLARFVRVSAGSVLVAYRTLSTPDGTKLRVQELMLPFPDRKTAPLEQGASLTVSYFDSTGLASDTRTLISQGALNVADEPVLLDLRADPRQAACG